MKQKITEEPGSGWRIIKVAGSAIINIPIKRDFLFLRLVWYSLKCLAIINDVAIFENSDGWIPIPPKIYHEFAPLIVWPKTKRPNNENMLSIYTMYDSCWKNFVRTPKTINPKQILNKINISRGYINEKSFKVCCLWNNGYWRN